MAQLNPQLAPIIQPPQLPYEVFAAQANAGVMPQIAAMNVIGETLGDKLPKAQQEKRRLQRLAESIKTIRADNDLPGSAKESLIESLVVGTDPQKVADSILDFHHQRQQLNLVRDEIGKKYGQDYLSSRWGDRLNNMPRHIWDSIVSPGTQEEVISRIPALNAVAKQYGLQFTGNVLPYNKAPWYSKMLGGDDKFLPEVVMIPATASGGGATDKVSNTGMSVDEALRQAGFIQ